MVDLLPLSGSRILQVINTNATYLLSCPDPKNVR